ncbi:MAG: hypothetical protein QNJ09_16095 [Paracoccaceae bacterium]|nr:hypothetical protein [Paracoccaceae bacterium]
MQLLGVVTMLFSILVTLPLAAQHSSLPAMGSPVLLADRQPAAVANHQLALAEHLHCALLARAFPGDPLRSCDHSDLSDCGARSESLAWSIGGHSVYDSRKLSNPPSWPEGVRATASPPMPENRFYPFSTAEWEWNPIFYALDSMHDVTEVNVYGRNDGGDFVIYYLIEIADAACGLELKAGLDTSGIVDIGQAEGRGPYVSAKLDIFVRQFRDLGAPADTINLREASVYRSWSAFPPADFDIGNPSISEFFKPGLHSFPEFSANLLIETKDIQDGDAFLVMYFGQGYASHSSMDFRFRLYRPKLFRRFYQSTDF